MKNLTLLMILATLTVIPAVASYLALEDGGNHIIGDTTYEDDHLRLDYDVANNPGTSLTLISGGIIGVGLSTFNTSKAIIDGGIIGDDIDPDVNVSANGNSEVEIKSGTIFGDVYSWTDSTVEINGGSIGGNLHARDEGVISIRGGTFDGYMDAWHGGTVYLYGTNFMVNEQSLSFGDNLRDFGVIGGESNDYLTGIITGTLEYGTEIDNEFRIVVTPDGGDIFIIPEPTTLSLFLLGSSILLRKRQA